MAVIPSGTSEPWVWAKREADANDALTRLFHQLIMQRENRLSNQAFQSKEKQLDRDARSDNIDQQGEWSYRNTNVRNAPPQVQPNSGFDWRGTSAPSEAPAASAPAVKAMPGSVAPIGPNTRSFSSNVDPNQKVAVLNALYGDTQASAQGTSGATDFSAQSRRPPEATQVRPKASVGGATGTTLKTLPKKQKLQADYADIPDHVLEAWDAIEKKYGLPQHTLLTIVGFETSGGKQVNSKRKSRDNTAFGPFQINDQTAKQYNVSDADRLDPIKSADAAARNMVAGHLQYQKDTRDAKNPKGLKLGTSFNDIPDWTMLHQYGIGDGPLLVRAGKTNSIVPASIAMRPGVIGNDGKPRDTGKVLAQNGMNGPISVRDLYAEHYKKVLPWANKAVRPADDSVDASTTPTQQGTRSPIDPAKPFTTAGRHVNTQKIDQRTQEAMRIMQHEFPEIVFTSGYRSKNPNSQHAHSTAFDVSLANLSREDKIRAVHLARALGANGLGNYGRNDIHVDFRASGPMIWGPNRHQGSYGRTTGWFQEATQGHMRGIRPAPYKPLEQEVATPVEEPVVRPIEATPIAGLQPKKAPKPSGDVSSQFGVQASAPLGHLDVFNPNTGAPMRSERLEPPTQARPSEADIDAAGRPKRVMPVDQEVPDADVTVPPAAPSNYQDLIASAAVEEQRKLAAEAADREARTAKWNQARKDFMGTTRYGIGSAPMPQSETATAIGQGIKSAATSVSEMLAPIMQKLATDKPKGPHRDMRLGGRQTDEEAITAILQADKAAKEAQIAQGGAPTSSKSITSAIYNFFTGGRADAVAKEPPPRMGPVPIQSITINPNAPPPEMVIPDVDDAYRKRVDTYGQPIQQGITNLNMDTAKGSTAAKKPPPINTSKATGATNTTSQAQPKQPNVILKKQADGSMKYVAVDAAGNPLELGPIEPAVEPLPDPELVQ